MLKPSVDEGAERGWTTSDDGALGGALGDAGACHCFTPSSFHGLQGERITANDNAIVNRANNRPSTIGTPLGTRHWPEPGKHFSTNPERLNRSGIITSPKR